MILLICSCDYGWVLTHFKQEGQCQGQGQQKSLPKIGLIQRGAVLNLSVLFIVLVYFLSGYHVSVPVVIYHSPYLVAAAGKKSLKISWGIHENRPTQKGTGVCRALLLSEVFSKNVKWTCS